MGLFVKRGSLGESSWETTAGGFLSTIVEEEYKNLSIQTLLNRRNFRQLYEGEENKWSVEVMASSAPETPSPNIHSLGGQILTSKTQLFRVQFDLHYDKHNQNSQKFIPW